MRQNGPSAPPRRITRTDLLAYGIAAGVGAFLLATPLSGNFTGDAVRYMGLADAIREGRGYEFNFRPHTRFPPGTAMILASTRGVIGDGHASDLATAAVFAGLSLVAGYTLLKTLGHPRVGLVALLIVATSAEFYTRGTQAVGSDFPFSFLCLAALTVAERVASGASARPALLRSLLLTLLVVATLMVRGAGLALLGALGLWSLLQVLGVRRANRRNVWLLLPAVVAGAVGQGVWSWWQSLNRADYWPGEFMNSYLAQLMLQDPHQPELGRAGLADFGARAAHNLTRHAGHLSELVTGMSWVDPRWYSPLVVLPVLFVSIGLFRAMREHPRIVELFLPLYVGLFLLWPFDEGLRYTLPVAPLLLLYAWLGLRHLRRLMVRDVRRGLMWACLAAAGLFLGGAVSLLQEAAVGRQAIASVASWLVLFLATAMVARNPTPMLGRAVDGSPVVVTAGAVILALVVLAGLSRQVSVARRNVRGDPALVVHRPSIEAARWLGPRLEPGDSAMAGQEAVVHYMTGYRVVPFPVTSDALVLKSVIDRFNVRYVVVYRNERYPYFLPTEEARLSALARAYPGLLVVAHETDDFGVYRISDTSASGASTAGRPGEGPGRR